MSSKLSNFFKADLDDVFLYQTDKCLLLKDRKVGIIFRICQLIVLIYFLLLAFFFDNGYQMSEVADGVTLLEVSAAGISRVNHDQQGSWDSLDVTNAFVEGENLFVATKVTQSFGQKIDKCIDYYRECRADGDCISLLGETCQAGRCFGPNWCTPDGGTLTAEYDVTDHYFLFFRSQVQFSNLGRKRTFSDMSTDGIVLYPAKNANTYTVGQILDMASVSYREVREEGAIVKVNVFWNCYVTNKNCFPTVDAARIDEFGDESFIGANEIKYTYYVDGTTTYRNVFNMTGVRMVFTTKARGRLFSFEGVVLQVATVLAFMKAIHFLFDIVLTKFKEYKTFAEAKYVVVEKITDEEVRDDEDEYGDELRDDAREDHPFGDEEDGLMRQREYSDEEGAERDEEDADHDEPEDDEGEEMSEAQGEIRRRKRDSSNEESDE